MTKETLVAGAVALSMTLAGSVSLTGQQRAVQPAPYRAPRTVDGKPDLQGIWQVLNTAEVDIQAHQAHLGLPAGLGVVEGNDLPYTPAALAQKQKNAATGAAADSAAKCFYPGVPRIMYIPHPFQIVQTPAYVGMFFEFGHHVRLIYTNGVPHYQEIPFWMGDSRGRWEGETFVVDTKGFNDETWFDKAGNFHSDALHVVERLTRTDADHIRYDVTIEDPKVFTRPWKMSMPLYRRTEPDARLLEYECFALSVYEGRRFDSLIKKP